MAIEAVLNMRWRSETVEFAGINHEFGFATERLHCLIHLLAAEDGHVPVDVSAHEQSRSGDGGDAVVGRNFVPPFAVLPGMAEFDIVIEDVLIMSVEGGEECCACAGNCGFEA